MSFIRNPLKDLRKEWRLFRGRLLQIPLVYLTAKCIRAISEDDGPHLAAGVAYYALLSLFPLILGIIAILGIFLPSDSVKDDLSRVFYEILPGSSDVVERNIDDLIRLRGPTGVFSLLMLFWAGSSMFEAVSRVINRAFGVRKDGAFIRRKLKNMGMALGTSVLLLLSLAASSILSILRGADVNIPFVALDIVAGFVGFVISFSVFMLLYKFLPNTRTRWRYVWPGAMVAAVSFEIAKTAFVLYLIHVGDYASIYGSIGSIIILVLWLYISAFILMLGAKFSFEYGRMKEGADRKS